MSSDEQWWAVMSSYEQWWAMMGNDEQWWAVMSSDEQWWAVMSNDEQWWAVMSSDEQWWAMMSSDEQWWAVMSNDEQLWAVMSNDGQWWAMMSSDEQWWAMMSNDEQLWAVMSNDGQWWAMKTSSVCPLSLQTSSHPPSIPSGLDGVQFWHGKEHLVKRLGIIQDTNLLWAPTIHSPLDGQAQKSLIINYLKDGILWTPKNSLDSALAISINQHVRLPSPEFSGWHPGFLDGDPWRTVRSSSRKKGSCPNINGYPLVN